MLEFDITQLRKDFEYFPNLGIISRLTGRRDHRGPLSVGATKVRYQGVSVQTGRMAWALYYGYWSTLLIDHKDGNRHNYKLDNLREATHQQNQFNKTPCGQFSKGVVYKADANRSKPWAARIRINGVKIPLGSFATEAEAAEAYRKKAEEIQGHFAIHL